MEQSRKVIAARKFLSFGSAAKTPLVSRVDWRFFRRRRSGKVLSHEQTRDSFLGLPGLKMNLAMRESAMELPETSSRGQKPGRDDSPERFSLALLRARFAQVRQRLEFVGAEGDWRSHLGLNSERVTFGALMGGS